MSSQFYDDFKFAMDCLGFGVPDPTLFHNGRAALETITAIVVGMEAAQSPAGLSLTLGQVLRHSPRLLKLGAIAGLVASAYLGACIGALAYASGQSLKYKPAPTGRGVTPLGQGLKAGSKKLLGSSQILNIALRHGVQMSPKSADIAFSAYQSHGIRSKMAQKGI